MAENSERKGIVWDGKINIPTVMMALSLLFGGWKFASDVSQEARTATQGLIEFKTDVREMKGSLKALEIAAAKADGLDARVTDHEARIRALEAR